MIDLQVSNGDLVLGDSSMGEPFATTESIGQRVYITFSVWLGDWFFDLTFGFDYKNFKASTQQVADLAIKAKLLSIPGVVSIISFSSVFKPLNRFYSFQVVYKTVDGINNTLEMGV